MYCQIIVLYGIIMTRTIKFTLKKPTHISETAKATTVMQEVYKAIQKRNTAHKSDL